METPICIRLHRVSSGVDHVFTLCSSCTSSCNCWKDSLASHCLTPDVRNEHHPSSVLCTPVEGRKCSQYLGGIHNSESTDIYRPLQTYFRTRQTKHNLITKHNKANVLRLGCFPPLHHEICWTQARALVLGSGVHTEIRPVTQFCSASGRINPLKLDSMSAARICSTVGVACCLGWTQSFSSF